MMDVDYEVITRPDGCFMVTFSMPDALGANSIATIMGGDLVISCPPSASIRLPKFPPNLLGDIAKNASVLVGAMGGDKRLTSLRVKLSPSLPHDYT